MVLDGKQIATKIYTNVGLRSRKYKDHGIVPVLAIVIATADSQARWYVRSIERAAKNCGIEVRVTEVEPKMSTKQVAITMDRLAADKSIHGLILQTPLYPHLNIDELISHIPVTKDIDGANPTSAGLLAYNIPSFAPATAEAVMQILDTYKIPLSGKHVVVVGRSRVVGKPLVQLLLRADATTTICHTKTRQLSNITKSADVLIVAAGQINLITSEYVTNKSVVIDVGTTVVDGTNLVGDVSLKAAAKVKSLTPVPGGVGTVTTALILQHTVTAVDVKRA